MAAPELDSVDRKLIEILAARGRTSMTALAGEVHLSRPAVQARVARLEEIGVIRGYHAAVRLPSGEDRREAILLCRFDTRPCAPVLAWLRGQPEVRTVWSLAGEDDAMIEVETNGAEALSAFIDRLAAGPYRIAARARAVLARFA